MEEKVTMKLLEWKWFLKLEEKLREGHVFTLMDLVMWSVYLLLQGFGNSKYLLHYQYDCLKY